MEESKYLRGVLRDLSIEFEWIDHEPVFTVAESESLAHYHFPVKNLLLFDPKTDTKTLIIMQGDKRLDTKHFARELGLKKPQFAKPDMLLETLGVTPGSVSLFSLLHSESHDVSVVVDQRLINEASLGFHPGTNSASVLIHGQSIEPFLQKTGHKYSIFALP